MSKQVTYTVAEALALVFGTTPNGKEYTTEHIRKVLSKLVGEELAELEMLDALRAADYAVPRPGTGKHLLRWKFKSVGGGRSTQRRQKPRTERSVAQSMRLKA